MNLRLVYQWNKLGLALSRIVGALRKEQQMVDVQIDPAGAAQDQKQEAQAAVVVQAEKVVAVAEKPYSVQITAWKGARDLALSAGAIAGGAAGMAILNWLTDNNAEVAAIIGRNFSTSTAVIIAMALKSIAEMVRNWLKSKKAAAVVMV